LNRDGESTAKDLDTQHFNGLCSISQVITAIGLLQVARFDRAAKRLDHRLENDINTAYCNLLPACSHAGKASIALVMSL